MRLHDESVRHWVIEVVFEDADAITGVLIDLSAFEEFLMREIPTDQRVRYIGMFPVWLSS